MFLLVDASVTSFFSSYFTHIVYVFDSRKESMDESLLKTSFPRTIYVIINWIKFLCHHKFSVYVLLVLILCIWSSVFGNCSISSLKLCDNFDSKSIWNCFKHERVEMKDPHRVVLQEFLIKELPFKWKKKIKKKEKTKWGRTIYLSLKAGYIDLHDSNPVCLRYLQFFQNYYFLGQYRHYKSK